MRLYRRIRNAALVLLGKRATISVTATLIKKDGTRIELGELTRGDMDLTPGSSARSN